MIQIKRILTCSLAAATLGLVTLAGSTAQGQPEGKQPAARQPEGKQPGRPGEGRGPGEGRAQSVEGSMKGMNRSMRQLEDQLGDASKKEDNLRLVGELQRNCAAAKNGQANVIREMKDEAAKAKASVAYRKHLIAVMRKLLDIEESIMADKIEAAKAQMGEVAKMRDDGHKELGVED